jgi:uncharacterized integral membrane protein (TIGR00697 family)
VRVRGTSRAFYKPISDLYHTKWINDFSREDGAFIAVLYVAEQQNNPEIIERFPRKKRYVTKHVVLLGMLFVSFLLLSNLTAFKIVDFHLNIFGIGHIQFPAALVFFPLTYFFDDTLTEVYGFKISRFMIWCGFLCQSMISLGIFVTVHLTPSHFWQYQNEYQIIFGSTFRIFLASSIAYIVGEFCNSTILSKIKLMTSGRWLWLRVISSTSIAVAIDSFIFCHIAFFEQVPESVIWKMIIAQYIFKVGYELLALPLTYVITSYLKSKDQIDYYDYQTSYNPFSMKIDD